MRLLWFIGQERIISYIKILIFLAEYYPVIRTIIFMEIK
jgi:hypothetical protein